jgi:hypothetical protein
MKVMVKIYTNDGEDHFYGFRNDFANSPELTMVHKFDLEVPVIDVHQILDWCFTEFNVGDGEHAKAYRAKRLRSLSVGDVVVVGESAWACESVNWSPVSAEELSNAIIAEDE